MKKISVIVPVYNAEKYLEQCATSLLSQTCLDMEIILVNDGSTDSSRLMCDGYCAAYPEIIKVIHQKNAGVSAARNAGLDAATGEWICFVDSDDWVEPDMIETMLAHSESADVHIYGHYKKYLYKTITWKYSNNALSEETKKNYRHQKQILINSAVWGKLIRRSLIEKINLRFCIGLPRGEDQIFLLYVIHHAEKVMLHENIFYNYRMVASGAVNKWRADTIAVENLFQKEYFEFVDKFFSGEENLLMKQTLAIDQLWIIMRAHKHPEAHLTRKEILSRLCDEIKREPLNSAIKKLPMTFIHKRKRFPVYLLRIRFIMPWFDLLRFYDWVSQRKITGYILFP